MKFHAFENPSHAQLVQSSTTVVANKGEGFDPRLGGINTGAAFGIGCYFTTAGELECEWKLQTLKSLKIVFVQIYV